MAWSEEKVTVLYRFLNSDDHWEDFKFIPILYENLQSARDAINVYKCIFYTPGKYIALIESVITKGIIFEVEWRAHEKIESNYRFIPGEELYYDFRNI